MNQSRPTRQRVDHPGSGKLFCAWVGLMVTLGVGITGCSMFKADAEKSKTDILKNAFDKAMDHGNSSHVSNSKSGPASEKVRLAGGLTLGDTNNLAFTPEGLAGVLNELTEAEKWNSTRRLIDLYPDIVSSILLGEGNATLSASHRQLIAKQFDQRWSGNGQDHWQQFVRSSGRHGKTGDFFQTRSTFLSFLENNQIDDALDLGIGRSIGSGTPDIAQAELLRLEGIAYLLAEDFPQSTDRLSRAMQLVETNQPYQASHVGLLLGEAWRHAGQIDRWQSSWESAIEIQSRWLAERGLCDPTFWSKAAFLRPSSTAWPEDVIRRLQISLHRENLEFGSEPAASAEAVVWATVGTQSLKRHESQNAILAFKKAEALVTNPSLKEELQMQQALAMIDGGQQGPASAILLRLSSKSSLLGDRAKAILATLKLQNGSLAQGMNLLQSAIKTSNQWPVSERLRAEADYGLAYLMLGRETQGIALLNQVYDEFLDQKSYDHAAQCLANIATYYEKTEQKAKHREAVARIKQLDRE